MDIFLDTSTLFKLYQSEVGTEDIDDFFKNKLIDKIYLSEITKIEFDSAVWKNIRMKAFDKDTGLKLIISFEADFKKFIFIDIDKIILNKAKELITKYGEEGLRTLDSIQLATAVSLKAKIDLNKSSDKLLTKLFEKEGLVVK